MKSHVAIDGVIQLLKGFGFKARGTVLHRSGGEDKIVHVVYVQSGRGPYEGRFTISMGVFFPSVYALRQAGDAPRFPQTNNCHVQARLSSFVGVSDIWWPSDDPQALADLEPAIREDLTRFFETWGSPSAVLERWKVGLPKRSVVTVSVAAVAAFLHEQHQDDEAAQALKGECIWFRDKGESPPPWIADVALKLGLDLKI